jgi:hypothetical protein
MLDILAKIETYKRAEIAAAKRTKPLASLEREAKDGAAAISRHPQAPHRRRQLRIDCRDQAREPLQRPHSLRF